MRNKAMERAIPWMAVGGLTVLLLVGFSPAASARQYPPASYKSGEAPWMLEEWEVRLFQYPNFVGKWIGYRMDPGMRQLLVPNLPQEFDGKFGSFQAGPKVGVTFFPEPSFEGPGIASTYAGYQVGWFPATKVGTESRTQISRQDTKMNGKFRSFIIYPAGSGETGVWLRTVGGMGLNYSFKFIPLPSMESVPDFSLGDLGMWGRDDRGARALCISEARVHVTLYEQNNLAGPSVTFPGSGGAVTFIFNLSEYQWQSRAASLRVSWIGPKLGLGPQAPVVSPVANAPATSSTGVILPTAKAKVRAKASPNSGTPQNPTATAPFQPEQAHPDISGQWQSSIGRIYTFAQTGSQFSWTVISPAETGQGTLSGKNITATWSGAGGNGSGTGAVTKVDAQGRATRIEWSNGVIFFR